MRIATAESCTGGMMAALLTEIPGASSVFERGFITYSNASKRDSLRVSPALLEDFGAVSAEVAQAMAEGALVCSPADLSIAVTGIAGPEGGSTEKPVGLVYIASARRDGRCRVERHHFSGNRMAVRYAAVEASLNLLQRQLSP